MLPSFAVKVTSSTVETAMSDIHAFWDVSLRSAPFSSVYTSSGASRRANDHRAVAVGAERQVVDDLVATGDALRPRRRPPARGAM